MSDLEQRAMRLVERNEEFALDSVFLKDCALIEFFLENCEMQILPHNRFFVSVDCEQQVRRIKRARIAGVAADIEKTPLFLASQSLAYTGSFDFSHTNAAWESVISLGIFGLRNRIASYAQTASGRREFYDGLLRVYDAALRFMRRAATLAMQNGREEMARGLLNLCEASPSSLFEALQTSVIYFVLQEYFDTTVLRTLGRLDSLFYPFYENADKASARQLLVDYLGEMNAHYFRANIPFAIGGSSLEGRTLCNALSFDLLQAYRQANTTNIKLHVLWTKDMPRALVKEALSLVREGYNSIVFMSDEAIIESLVKQGASREDAVRYHVVGCYECGAEGELTCSCNARVNVPKALELALNGGCDMLTGERIGLAPEGELESYEQLLSEFERQLSYLCRCAMELTDLYEERYAEIHAAPILSATYLSSLEAGKDLYCGYAAKYNSSSLNALGLATAADSLAAIRKAVFEDRVMTLRELSQILRSDWQNEEYTRLLIKNKYPKYGMGDKRVDAIAKRIVDVLEASVVGKPNVKGGCWRLGLFSIDWRWDFGAKTAATADGRRSGEVISQNTGASFGADREGATAHLLSVASLDSSRTPNGAIVDIDLHSSAVSGENGLLALHSALEGYFALGGFGVQYNILDTRILKDAKLNPEKYPNLQVRLCGWNVLFSTLSEQEKDEFIARYSKR